MLPKRPNEAEETSVLERVYQFGEKNQGQYTLEFPGLFYWLFPKRLHDHQIKYLQIGKKLHRNPIVADRLFLLPFLIND
jgi:hypothetical protein